MMKPKIIYNHSYQLALHHYILHETSAVIRAKEQNHVTNLYSVNSF